MNYNDKGQTVYCGIDFHKNTSTLCALYQDGREAQPIVTVQTSSLVAYLANRDWKIGVEVTGGVNHLAEQLKAQGHEVVIFNSNQFRGIGIGGKKTDERDARALAEALRLNFVPEIYHRSKYCRQIKSLLTSREHVVQTRVDSINHVRGTLREYGITMPMGAEVFYSQAREKIEKLDCLQIRESLLLMLESINRYRDQEKLIETYLFDLTKEDHRITRLQSAPGIGKITALMMVAVIDDISRFKNAKEFASYLGLVPSVHASANKRMMGSITRSGSEMLRRYLIHGARAWMRYSPKDDQNRVWAERVKERRGMNKAVVALAHRMARISYAMLRDDAVYKAPIMAA